MPWPFRLMIWFAIAWWALDAGWRELKTMLSKREGSKK